MMHEDEIERLTRTRAREKDRERIKRQGLKKLLEEERKDAEGEEREDGTAA